VVSCPRNRPPASGAPTPEAGIFFLRKIQSGSGFQTETVTVSELSCQDSKNIHDPANAKQAASKQVQNAHADSANVEIMGAKLSQKQAQPECNPLFLVARNGNVCHVFHD
jgi:hypothetical protein